MKTIIFLTVTLVFCIIGEVYGFSLIGRPCENCLYGSTYCDMYSECQFGCMPGWLEPTCTKRCISDCVECRLRSNGAEECTRCHGGVYGVMCNQPCSNNCNSFSGNQTCDFFGNCLFGCKIPYVGDRCTKQSCPFDHCLNCRVGPYDNLYCSRCDAGYYWNSLQQECQPCSIHCKPDALACDSYTGTCDACLNGWFGTRCNHQCNIQKCVTCGTKHYQNPTPLVYCKTCEGGTYPNTNGSKCVSCEDRHCIGVCSPNNGNCPHGCEPGWFGRNFFCDRECTIAHCEQCALNFQKEAMCVRCKSGYYINSDKCVRCPSYCNGPCDDRTGNCDIGCLSGYYGTTCDRTCSYHCKNRTCDSTTGHCECDGDWFGVKCDRNCPTYCTDCYNYVPGLCASCEPGRYGPVCENKCNEHCVANSYNDYTYCDKETGKCRYGCSSGYYGEQCEIRCSLQCMGDCDRKSGVCLVGCSHHVYGEKCDIPCPQNCAYAVLGYQRTCDMNTGSCSNGCQAGYFGDFCNRTCEKNCKDNVCGETGNCVHGCSSGYTGKDCNIICKTDCPGDCSPNCALGMCDSVSKLCTSGCSTGWWGTSCQNICNEQCEFRTCHQQSGECRNTCNTGFYGSMCSQTCSDFCHDRICDKNTGECLLGCVDSTYHGALCNIRCLSTCRNQSCDRETGACFLCGIGKHGPSCDQDCFPGWYGENCESQCGKCKDSNPCNIIDGNCPSGCEVGWTGAQCSKSFYRGEEVPERTPTLETAVGCSVAVVVVVIILVVVVFCWRRRKGNQSKHKQQEPVVVYRDASATIETAGTSNGIVTSARRTEAESDRDSDRSDTMMLGSDTSGLQVTFDGVYQQTDVYKMYKGQMISGGKAQDCYIRISQIDAVPDKSKELWNRLMNESELQRMCCTHTNVLQLFTTYQNKNMFCLSLEPSVGLCLKTYLTELASKSAEINTQRDQQGPRRGPEREPGAPSSENKGQHRESGVGNESSQRETLQMNKLFQFCVEIASAIGHLHKLKVLHRQVEACHVYLSDALVVKLGDFYWAESATADMRMGELEHGNYRLLAPESFLKKQYTYQSDIWSLGLCLWEILSLGKTPYNGTDEAQHRQMVLNGVRPSKPHLVQQTMNRLLKNCWRYSIDDRPSAEQVLQQLLDIQSRYLDTQDVVVQV